MVPRGWKVSAALFTAFCSLVFITNLSVLVWAATQSRGPSDTTLILRTGSNSAQCDAIQDLNKWGHLLINVLSTVLLSGSNYCMQCLSAPTRSDINSAHLDGRWLDVGVPSIHNLRWISRRRLYLWLVLGLSSLPLHLFYNSAVFTSTSSNNYSVYSVDHAFLESSTLNSSNYANVGYLLRGGYQLVDMDETIHLAGRLRQEANDGRLVNRTMDECITQYTKPFQSSYRNLLLVGEPNVEIDLDASYGLDPGDFVNNNASNLVNFLYARFHSDFICAGSQASEWTCVANGTVAGVGPDEQCNLACEEPRVLQQTLSNSTWAPLGPKVQYCLAEPTETQCSLQFSVGIAVLVVVLNFVKLTTMALTVVFAFDEDDPPLLTMGDAVSSFLEKPDDLSKGMCLISALKIKKLGTALWHRQADMKVIQYPGGVRQRWSKAVSSRRWFVCLLLYVAGLSTAAGYLSTGLNAMVGSKTLSSLWAIGFGIPSGRTLIRSDATESGKASLITAVVLANIPQLVLSMLYFTYNGLFTCMLLANEWNSYSTQRKGLRVSSSHPQGAQRSGYFLQLPYRFSIPLVIFSLLFHWLISQSIFVVNINMFDSNGSPITNASGYVGHLVTCGYSPIAIIFSLVLGVGLVCALLGYGLGVRFKTGMPIAGSCSLAMAAACHLNQGRSEDSEKRILAQQLLMWGEVGGHGQDPDPSEAGLHAKSTPSLPLRDNSSYPSEKLTAQARVQVMDVEGAALLPGRRHMKENLRTLLPPSYRPSRKADSMQSTYATTTNSDNEYEDTRALVPGGNSDGGHCAFSDGPVTKPVKGRFYS